MKKSSAQEGNVVISDMLLHVCALSLCPRLSGFRRDMIILTHLIFLSTFDEPKDLVLMQANITGQMLQDTLQLLVMIPLLAAHS